jgi:hypothetical protein
MRAILRKIQSKPRPDLRDCAKGRMHDAVAQKIVITMPGGFIA